MKKIIFIIIIILFILGSLGYLSSKHFENKKNNQRDNVENFKKNETIEIPAEEINRDVLECEYNDEGEIIVTKSCYVNVKTDGLNNIMKFVIKDINESKTLASIEVYVNERQILSIKDMEFGSFYNIVTLNDLIAFCYHNGNDIRSKNYVVVSMYGDVIMHNREFDFQDLNGMTLYKLSEEGPLYVKDDSLFLEGSRISHGPSVVSKNTLKNLSEVDLNEIVEVVYEFKYLGNNKFKKPKLIRSVTVKEFCENYEDGYDMCMNP